MPSKTTAAERMSPEMGKRLADARKAMGYTQRQMAEMFEITDVAWRNYERGRELWEQRVAGSNPVAPTSEFAGQTQCFV